MSMQNATPIPQLHVEVAGAEPRPLFTRHGSRWVGVALAALLLIAGGAILGAMQRTSTTFDEIVMIAAGARGFETGDWKMAPEHPPLVQYLYGLPVHLSGPAYPDESGVPPEARTHMGYRYGYAQGFFWRSGNDPEVLAFLGRLPAVLCALALVLVVFLYARRIGGNGAGLLAAAATATLPDVLAHGGVAYNDLPLALAFLGAIWAIDEAVRGPTLGRALLAGLLIGLALGTKNSAIALAPIAVLLLAAEAAVRWRDGAWRRRAAGAAAVVLGGAYVALVLIYRGDATLTEYRYAVNFAIGHVTEKLVTAFLLGSTSTRGWWYFFPVAFLYKTSAGLHILLGISTIGLAGAVRARPRSLLTSRLRAPAAGILVFGALLLRSDLNIGFRYALPLLPLLCIVAGVGVVHMWPRAHRLLKAAAFGGIMLASVHVASYYPWFLSYISEYGPGRDENHTVLVDSSLDWGQGLLDLRRVMQREGIESVYLSYFGSALPSGYGISFLPLASFFPLAAQEPPAEEPKWVAISATNLSGTYFVDDPFATFRNARPEHIAGGSIYLYRIRE